MMALPTFQQSCHLFSSFCSHSLHLPHPPPAQDQIPLPPRITCYRFSGGRGGYVHDGSARGGDKEDGGLLPYHVLFNAVAPHDIRVWLQSSQGQFLPEHWVYHGVCHTISALVVGGCVFLLGLADVVYKLDFIQSFAFGSLISAVDPVATLAIFQALDVDPVLNMLVFGESILNDAVAIVLTTTIIESSGPDMQDIGVFSQIGGGITRFFGVFFGSAAIGTLVAMTSALVLKQIDLYTNPSLEFALMLCFIYTPYALAEGVHLSGIMAILFCGVVMSHYTHYNMSPITQITMQQTMRTLAFVSESSIFIYLGLGIFSFPHRVELSLVVWSLVLILVGRALNIFPLSLLCNKFRSHQITKRMMD